MIIKCMKKVRILVIYIERCQVLKVFLPFIANSMEHDAKNKS